MFFHLETGHRPWSEAEWIIVGTSVHNGAQAESVVGKREYFYDLMNGRVAHKFYGSDKCMFCAGGNSAPKFRPKYLWEYIIIVIR
jgi:hypothetical protein